MKNEIKEQTNACTHQTTSSCLNILKNYFNFIHKIKQLKHF